MGTGLREKIYEAFSNDLPYEVLPDFRVGKVKLYNTVCDNERFIDLQHCSEKKQQLPRPYLTFQKSYTADCMVLKHRPVSTTVGTKH